MPDSSTLFCLIMVTALVTYLLRVVPLVLLRKPLQNRYFVALLEYMPYALLSAMLFPSIFYSTGGASFPEAPALPSVAGAVVALVCGFLGLNLPFVAAAASVTAFVFQYI